NHIFLHFSPPYPLYHPFPTRRSSDLPAYPAGTSRSSTELSPLGVGWRCPSHVISRLLVRRSLTNYRFFTSTPASPIRQFRRQRIDRKSTRLNSSHRTISYAVFCLKKK